MKAIYNTEDGYHLVLETVEELLKLKAIVWLDETVSQAVAKKLSLDMFAPEPLVFPHHELQKFVWAVNCALPTLKEMEDMGLLDSPKDDSESYKETP